VAPKGQSTRPTADRARQALFNVLEHAAWAPGLAGARVIDSFAGSGALGLEALSRGADFCLFVDNDPAARDAVAANISALGCEARCAVVARDGRRLGLRTPDHGEAFSLAFLDPPYGGGIVVPALDALATGGWLRPGAIAVVERGVGEGPLEVARFEVLDERQWGAARVTFLAVT
jgi:16S rRNA (guanine966-N2)-methyltransferase